MVDNLRQYLEKEAIAFSTLDEELYIQLISYVVVKTTSTGRPVFEAGGSAVDHAHDALILALLAITENYGALHKMNFAAKAGTFSNTFFMPKKTEDEDGEEKPAVITRDTLKSTSATTGKTRIRRGNISKSVTRKMF